MKVVLVQHGEAKSKDEDPDRSLTDAGIKKTKKIAAWLGKQDVDIVEIRHSGKKRAEQTAAIFADRLAPARGVIKAFGMNPNDDVRAYVMQMEKMEGVLMLVGHLPFLDRLAGLLLAGDPEKRVISFVNSGVVCLEKHKGQWTISWSVVPELLNGLQ